MVHVEHFSEQDILSSREINIIIVDGFLWLFYVIIVSFLTDFTWAEEAVHTCPCPLNSRRRLAVLNDKLEPMLLSPVYINNGGKLASLQCAADAESLHKKGNWMYCKIKGFIQNLKFCHYLLTQDRMKTFCPRYSAEVPQEKNVLQ